ncbi:MAG: hypothetical protein HMLKMBBP_00630 [Planctomycetes bacterium]|nr:hypothetical protein [Planctomycetota bacterium]
MRTASSAGIGPSRVIRSRSVSPSTYSIANQTSPSDSPLSSPRTMFGWSSFPTSSASRRSRSTCRGSLVRSRRRIFTATCRFIPFCHAL